MTRNPASHIRKLWIAVSTSFGLISSVHHYFHHHPHTHTSIHTHTHTHTRDRISDHRIQNQNSTTELHDDTPSPPPLEYVNFFKPFHFTDGDQLVVPIGASHISSWLLEDTHPYDHKLMSKGIDIHFFK